MTALYAVLAVIATLALIVTTLGVIVIAGAMAQYQKPATVTPPRIEMRGTPPFDRGGLRGPAETGLPGIDYPAE